MQHHDGGWAGRSSFKHVHPYAVDIPSFGCPWGFNMCYNTCAYPDAPNWDAETVNKKLVEALGEKSGAALDRVYSVAARLSGLSAGAVEESAGNFGEAPGASSSSG